MCILDYSEDAAAVVVWESKSCALNGVKYTGMFGIGKLSTTRPFGIVKNPFMI